MLRTLRFLTTESAAGPLITIVSITNHTIGPQIIFYICEHQMTKFILTIPLFLTLCFYVIYIIRHIRIHRPRFAYSLYNFYWATMTIKGSLRVSIAIVKAILADC